MCAESIDIQDSFNKYLEMLEDVLIEIIREHGISKAMQNYYENNITMFKNTKIVDIKITHDPFCPDDISILISCKKKISTDNIIYPTIYGYAEPMKYIVREYCVKTHNDIFFKQNKDMLKSNMYRHLDNIIGGSHNETHQ